jgi:hypothetical protein
LLGRESPDWVAARVFNGPAASSRASFQRSGLARHRPAQKEAIVQFTKYSRDYRASMIACAWASSCSSWLSPLADANFPKRRMSSEARSRLSEIRDEP